MGLDPISSIAEAATTALNKIFPDADLKMKEKFALATQQIQIEAQAALAQTDINKVEAQSPQLFVAGWRPCVGWICCLGLSYSFFIGPILTWIATLAQKQGPPPLDVGPLLSLLVALLGVGSLRTLEKIQGVDTKGVS